MSLTRSEYRSIATEAISASPHFAGVSRISAWASAVNAADLPAYGVATPSGRRRRVDLDTLEIGTLLAVVLKRAGSASIEADLEGDAEAIEDILTSAFWARGVAVPDSSHEIKLDGTGAQMVGSLTVTLNLTERRSLSDD